MVYHALQKRPISRTRGPMSFWFRSAGYPSRYSFRVTRCCAIAPGLYHSKAMLPAWLHFRGGAG